MQGQVGLDDDIGDRHGQCVGDGKTCLRQAQTPAIDTHLTAPLQTKQKIGCHEPLAL